MNKPDASRKNNIAMQFHQMQETGNAENRRNSISRSIRSSLSSAYSIFTKHSHSSQLTKRHHISRSVVYSSRYSITSVQSVELEIVQQAPEEKQSAFTTFCAFVAATISACSSLYICDSIATQEEYLTDYLMIGGKHINDSELGWLSSVIFLLPLFMSVVCAPFIDKYGCLTMGIVMNSYNLVLTIPTIIYWDSFYGLIISRVFAGMFAEATFLVECQIIVEYIPGRLEGMGFGICVSIATSANLIGYFLIPVIMKGYKPGYWSDNPNEELEWKSKMIFTFWLNLIVAASVLGIYILCCIPLYVIERRRKQEFLRKQPKVEKDEFVSFNTKIPNNLPMIYKFFKGITLPLDYWLLNISYCLLSVCCYGAQTMLLTFITKHRQDAQIQGIIRSVASIVGGIGSGFLVTVFGRRCELQALSFVAAIISYVGLMFCKAFNPGLSMFIIGYIDGAAATLGKSLFEYVLSFTQLSNGYAFSDTILNIGQFLVSPIAGMLSSIDFPVKSAGILWFFILLLLIGITITIEVIFRNRLFYNSALSCKPK